MSNRRDNRDFRASREQIERSQFAYSQSLYSTSQENQPVGFLIPITQKIEKQIMDQIYLEKNSKLFSSISRFQMIPTKPTSKFVFQSAKGIFKGKFQCKNPRCTQQKRRPTNKKQSVNTNIQEQTSAKKEQPTNETKQEQTKPKRQVKEQQDQGPRQYRSWGEWWKQNRPGHSSTFIDEKSKKGNQQTKEELGIKLEDDGMPPGRENTRWSSSISYVTIHFNAFPVELKDFKKIFQREKKTKLEIYFFISVLGQKCRKCESQEFIQPDYGEREMKRIRHNFATYIYNMIYGAKGGYMRCKLRKLRKHEEEYCEACYRGVCGDQDLK